MAADLTASPRPERPWNIAYAALSLVLCGLVVARLLPLVRSIDGLPLWDGAGRGLVVVQLAGAIAELDVLQVVGLIHGMALWPPTYSVLTAPAVLVGGIEVAVLRGAHLTWFVVGAMSLFASGPGLDRRGYLIGFIAVTMFALSPMSQLFGTLIYLEIPGLALQMMALALVLRSWESPSALWARLAALALLALFFCKYNYGLLLLVPIAFLEIAESPGKAEACGALRQRWRQWRRSTRLGWCFVALYVGFLMVLVMGGGAAFDLGGQRVSMRSAGNPAYLLVLLLVVRFLFEPRLLWRRFTNWRAQRSQRHRALVDWLAWPIILWFLLPPHLKEFFGFLQNRSSGLGLWSLDNLVFYPRAFVFEYAPSPGIGVATLGLAAIGLGLACRRSATRGMRLLAIALAVGLVAAWLHPYKADRFFLTVAGWVWLMASAASVQLLGAPLDRGPFRHATPHQVHGFAAFALVVCMAATAFLVPRSVDDARFRNRFVDHTVPNSRRPVLARLAELSQASSPTMLLGTWNRFSPALVEWGTRWHDPQTPSTTFARPIPGDLRGLDPHHTWNLLCDNLDVQQVLVLTLERPETWEQEYRQEVAWEAGFRQALTQSPHFEPTTDESFDASGYRLQCYRRVNASALP